MELAICGAHHALSDMNSQVTVPVSFLTHITYYLYCVHSVLTVEFPVRLREYECADDFSREELTTIFALAIAFSPDVMETVSGFVPDTMAEVCRLGNRFCAMAETQIAAVATDQVVIVGQQVRVRKVMPFTAPWLRRYCFDPIRHLATLINTSLYSSVNILTETDSSRRPTESCDLLTCWLNRRTVFLVDGLIIAMVIGFAFCLGYKWLQIDDDPLTNLEILLLASLIHIMVQYGFLYRDAGAASGRRMR
jgi:hypothetical protein